MVTFIKSKKFLLILFLLLFVSSSTALALEIDWPISPGGTVLNDDSDVGDMIQYFYEWAIALGGLATFVSLVFGGFKYLSSMGRPEAMKEAKDQITSAFAGLVLLLSAWLILNTINPDLTTFRRSSYDLSYQLEQTTFDLASTNSCDYIVLYDYLGNPIPDTGGETKIYEGFGMVYLTAIPHSLRAFLNDKECTEDGCGCYVQLHIDQDSNGVCDLIVWNYNAYSDDVTEIIDPENRSLLKCAEVQGGGCNACYVEDSDGKCVYQGDTGWGDNEHLCIGSDKRCFDGGCRICQGYLAEDGCGGCTTPGSPSTLACWHRAPDNDDIFRAGFSCDYTCENFGGCIEENWNDDINCTVCKRLFQYVKVCVISPCLYCNYEKGSSPQYNAYSFPLPKQECSRRDPAVDQGCSYTADAPGTTVSAPWEIRICVCGW